MHTDAKFSLLNSVFAWSSRWSYAIIIFNVALIACGKKDDVDFLVNPLAKVVGVNYALSKDMGDTLSDPWIFDVKEIYPALCCFELDGEGKTWGAKGGGLYRTVVGSDGFEFVRQFTATVHGIHWTADNVLYVATDADRWDQNQPCRIYRSFDGGESFRLVKVLRTGSVLWWSISSDRKNNVFVGEYGPRDKGSGKRVWKTSDHGLSWEVAFHAPNIDGIHIHRVAVDPFTNHVWVTYGDNQHQGVFRSVDEGATWSKMRHAQSTAVVFTEEAIYWGEDTFEGKVTRFDRRTGRFTPVLTAMHEGSYGGSVYDMAIGKSGLIYVPMVKYSHQSHIPTLWVGDGRDWKLLIETNVEENRFGGFEHISSGDPNGFLFLKGYRIEERSKQLKPKIGRNRNTLDVAGVMSRPDHPDVATTMMQKQSGGINVVEARKR